MKIEFTDLELKRMEEMRNEDKNGNSRLSMLISPSDIGKEFSISFEIVDYIKAECFIMNLLNGRNQEICENTGILFTSFNFNSMSNSKKDQLLNELIAVIDKYR